MATARYRLNDGFLEVSVGNYPTPLEGFPGHLRQAGLDELVPEAARVLMYFYQGITVLARDWAERHGAAATCLRLNAEQLPLFLDLAMDAEPAPDRSAIAFRWEI